MLYGRSPIGQHLSVRRRPPLKDTELEIVGVARNARYGALKGEFRSIVYIPFNQPSYRAVDEIGATNRRVRCMRSTGAKFRINSTRLSFGW